MVTRFSPTEKTLDKAEPDVIMLMRADGQTEWYEGAKAGQVFEIESGREKAYILLEPSKIQDLGSIAQEKIVKYKGQTYALTEVNINEGDIERAEKNKKIANKITLNINKRRNLGNNKKPVMGFVCYEKEAIALPTDVKHDSKHIARLIDFIRLAFKDFATQKIDAIVNGIVIVAVVIGAAVLIYFWKFAPKEAPQPEQVNNTVTQFKMMIPFLGYQVKKWLQRTKQD